MKPSETDMKRYTLLRRADDARRDPAAPAGRPGIRRLTLIRRAQLWPPLPAGARSPQR